jgi:anhydro-N-acetylmuramic acid kinase
MNKNLEKLYGIAAKTSRTIIGLMSGTSLDGLDIAVCRISGAGLDTEVKLLFFETVAYDNTFKEQIRSVFARRDADLEKVCLLNEWVAKQHAGMIMHCLAGWNIAPEEIDLVASHGQTIYHSPKLLRPADQFGNATLQIGDGDHLSVATGIITLSDFRQKHIAAGGEGAPLAVYGDYFIFSKKGEERIMLNIGGIGNFTYLPGDLDAGRIFSTDTGPGNTMMDAYMQQYYGLAYDRNAVVASLGSVNEKLLAVLLNHSFFNNGFPKTTGPELFNLQYLSAAIAKAGQAGISHEDVMATLNYFSAFAIAKAIKACTDGHTTFSVYTSGGGMHNPILMKHIKALLPGHLFYTTDSLGINPDAKEAVLFALLANESVAGGDIPIGNTRDIPSVSMGKISFPS